MMVFIAVNILYTSVYYFYLWTVLSLGTFLNLV